VTKHDLLAEAAKLGYEVSRTRKGHLRLIHDSGAIVVGPSTPSDHRSWRNTASQLRKSLRERGVVVEERRLPARRVPAADRGAGSDAGTPSGQRSRREHCSSHPRVDLAERLRRCADHAALLPGAGQLVRELRALAGHVAKQTTARNQE
jgi:hypothetical protein